MTDIKAKHTEIIRLEKKQKDVQAAIKVQKDKGYSPRTSKASIQKAQTINENAVFRLEQEIKQIELDK